MASTECISGIHYEIMKRCYNKNSKLYYSYGAKGIKVAPKWHDAKMFEKWAIKNGYKPGMCLRRYDNSKNYSSHNCYLTYDNPYKQKEINKKRMEEKRIKNMIKKEIGLDKCSNTRLYKIYAGMHDRCERTKHESYANYGGRGIKVCKKWSGKYGFYEFYRWANENGFDENAETYECTLDRIDTNKGYYPSNCRFVDMKTQINNRRNTIYIVFNEEQRYVLKDFCDSGDIYHKMLNLYHTVNGPLTFKIGKYDEI